MKPDKKLSGFSYCKSPKNKLLFFDLYIPEINIYIEYDGEQHFKVVEKWNGEEGLEYRKICDKIKDDFCLKNRIKLIRISYMENIEEKIKLIEETNI